MKKVPVQISVVIATKNEEENIGRLLASLTQQTFKDFEIIVVDNYSTDKTRQIAQEFTDKIYIRKPERSAQRNFGLKKSKGQYIIFADADMELKKNLLAACYQKLSKNPKLSGIILKEISKGHGFFARVKTLEKKIASKSPCLAAARFFRKKDLQKIGGYDQNLIAGEDWDLSQRMTKFGKLATVSSAIYHWEITSFWQDVCKKYYYARNIQKYQDKHPESFKKQAGLNRLLELFQNPEAILAQPAEFTVLIALKTAHYAAYLLARLHAKIA